MKKYLLLLFISSVLMVSCGKQEKPFSREAMLKDIYSELILPSFKNFSDECTKLTQLVDSYSKSSNEETLKACRKQWIQVVLSWRHCDIYNVGKYQRSFIKSKIYNILLMFQVL